MIDFSPSIIRKSNDLISKANSLTSIQFEWQPPINIDCCNISTNIKGIEESQLNPLVTKVDFPALYYFKLIEYPNHQNIIDRLKQFKDKKTHSCPKIDNKRSMESQYLYVGSVKNNLHGRLIQHLGKGHKLTYSLQLNHWSTDLNLKLEYNYAWLDKKHKDVTELLEAALADYLLPLVGKH
jgi:hypothetical protein